jgi:hypothetical protein
MIFWGLHIYDMINKWAKFGWKKISGRSLSVGPKNDHVLAKKHVFCEKARIPKKGIKNEGEKRNYEDIAHSQC